MDYTISEFLRTIRSGTSESVQAVQDHPLLTVYVAQERMKEIIEAAFKSVLVSTVETALSSYDQPPTGEMIQGDDGDFAVRLLDSPIKTSHPIEYDLLTGKMKRKRGRPKGSKTKKKQEGIQKTLTLLQKKAEDASPNGYQQHTWEEDDLISIGRNAPSYLLLDGENPVEPDPEIAEALFLFKKG